MRELILTDDQKLAAWEKLYQGFERYFKSQACRGFCYLINMFQYEMNLSLWDKLYLMTQLSEDIILKGYSPIYLFKPEDYESRKKYILEKIESFKGI